MDAEKILTILVQIYCQQEGLTLETLEIKRKDEQAEKTA